MAFGVGWKRAPENVGVSCNYLTDNTRINMTCCYAAANGVPVEVTAI
jgi:hypothetical protein